MRTIMRTAAVVATLAGVFVGAACAGGVKFGTQVGLSSSRLDMRGWGDRTGAKV